MMNKKLFTEVIVGLILTIGMLSADVPYLIDYQGRLTDENGVPIDGNVSILFSIYDVETGGTDLWHETQYYVYVSNGLFHVFLGAVGPIPENIFNDPDCWLGITVAGDGEMTPRIMIGSVPYAKTDGDWVIDGNDMYADVSGNVGIGTIPNDAKLEIGTATNSGIRIGSCGNYGIDIITSTNHGVYVGYTGNGGYGFRVNNSGASAFSVFAAGLPTAWSSSNLKSGFQVDGAEGYGLYVGHADEDGVHIDSSDKYGVYVSDVDLGGFRVAYAGDDGLSVNSAGDDGVYINATVDEGVNILSAGDIGVYSNTNATWGFYTPDATYSNGGYYQARIGTFGRNVGSTPLESGDLVCISGGYDENVFEENCVPIINISKANSSNSQAISGVVEYKAYIREDVEEMEDGKTEIQKSFRFVEGNIMPGDYLSFIVFGPADVKVNRNESIVSGEILTAGNGNARKVQTTEVNGITIAENIGILGKALEDSNGKGMMKVFVNCK